MNHGGPTLIGSATDMTFDGTGDVLAWVFQAWNTEAITHIGFRYATRIGTVPTLIAALESLSGGNPSGTVLGGGTPASGTFTPPSDTTWNGTFQWVSLANSYTPTRGQLLCATIRHSSGTIDGSNGCTITRGLANSQNITPVIMGSHRTNLAGSYTKSSLAYTFAYRTASGRYGFPATGAYTTATAATSGHRQAMYFTLPSGWGDTYQLTGCTMYAKAPSSGGTADFKIGIWDASGTELASTGSLNSTDLPGSAGWMQGIFTSVPTLSFGTKYYVGVETLTSGTVALNGIQLGSADDRLAYPLGTSRGLSGWNGSAWTDVDTVVPYCDLIFEDITEPAGGSGGAYVIGG